MECKNCNNTLDNIRYKVNCEGCNTGLCIQCYSEENNKILCSKCY